MNDEEWTRINDLWRMNYDQLSLKNEQGSTMNKQWTMKNDQGSMNIEEWTMKNEQGSTINIQ